MKKIQGRLFPWGSQELGELDQLLCINTHYDGKIRVGQSCLITTQSVVLSGVKKESVSRHQEDLEQQSWPMCPHNTEARAPNMGARVIWLSPPPPPPHTPRFMALWPMNERRKGGREGRKEGEGKKREEKRGGEKKKRKSRLLQQFQFSTFHNLSYGFAITLKTALYQY